MADVEAEADEATEAEALADDDGGLFFEQPATKALPASRVATLTTTTMETEAVRILTEYPGER